MSAFENFLFVVYAIIFVPIIIYVIYRAAKWTKAGFDARDKNNDSGAKGWIFSIIIILSIIFVMGLCTHLTDDDDDYYPQQEYRHTD